MQAHLDFDTIDLSSETILALQSHLETAANAITHLDKSTLSPDSSLRLAKLLERLEFLAMCAMRAATSIKSMPVLNKTPAYGSDFLVALEARLTTDRGHSIHPLCGMPAGTSFVIDDYWEMEQGILIGVVWDTPEKPFFWLSPLEFMTATRSTEQ